MQQLAMSLVDCLCLYVISTALSLVLSPSSVLYREAQAAHHAARRVAG